MAETILEFVKRHLDDEVQSEVLHPLPADFYSRVSQYSQKLRRSMSSGNSEATNRLVARQTEMIESMTRELFNRRVEKASRGNAYLQLLPEERYVCSTRQRFQKRFDAFIEALSTGQPSFIEFAHRRESARNTTVRFTKRINELIGTDLRRYGPFEVDDLASIPASNADILIAGGDAVEVYSREES